MIKKIYSGIFLATMIAIPAQADIFDLTANVDGIVVSDSFRTVEDILEGVDSESLQELVASYTESSAVYINLNIRGLPAVVSYAAASNTLVLDIRELGVYEVFTGGTRDESQEMLEDYIEDNGRGILDKILNYMVEETATDPVAGNPNSLMAQMGSADFLSGSDLKGGSQLQDVKKTSENNTVSMGMRFGSYSVEGYDTNVYSLPFKYSHRFNSDPRKQLIFDLPLIYTDTEGSDSYSASLGVGLRMPVNDDWSLTPMLRVGAVGSIDLGSAAILYSGSLTSNYNLYWDDFKFSIGNMGAYYQTSAIDAGDYQIDYDLTNTMIKNGIGVEGPVNFSMWGNPTSWQCDLAHTAFFGDDLYVDNYMDLSFSYGTRVGEDGWNNIRLGMTYTQGEHDYKGIRVNFGYTF